MVDCKLPVILHLWLSLLYNKIKVKPIKPTEMKKYIFKIVQQFSDGIDDQNVWTVAHSKEEAIRYIKREYHSIVDITLIRVTNYEN